jgi:ABC-type multidrug transport system fused ATPase/permease subunit
VHIVDLPTFYWVFASLTVLTAIQHYTFKYAAGVVGERFSLFVRELTFHHQMHQPLATQRKKADGKYLLRYSGDLQAVQNYLVKGIIQFAADTLFILLFIFFALRISSFLSILILGLYLFGYAITYALSKATFSITKQRRTERSKLLGFVSSRMQAFLTIKAFNREKKEINSFKRRSRNLYDAGLTYFKKTSLVQGVIPLLYFLSMGIALYWIASSYEKTLNKSLYVSFILMFLYMQTILKRAQRTTLVWQFGKVSFEKLVEILNQEKEPRVENFSKHRFQKSIELKGVSFFHASASGEVLKGININLNKNGIHWLRAKANSGKSTLLKLIVGLYQPAQGEILYDGISNLELTPFEIRRSVTLVAEDAPILGGSIKKSILFNDEPTNRIKAVELMRMLHFQPSLSDEELLNMKLEDGARNLSSSDRMKLQLVRAFVTQKKIVLLDNPFAYFDESTQLIVTNFLNRIENNYLIILASGSVPSDLSIRTEIVLTK